MCWRKDTTAQKPWPNQASGTNHLTSTHYIPTCNPKILTAVSLMIFRWWPINKINYCCLRFKPPQANASKMFLCSLLYGQTGRSKSEQDITVAKSAPSMTLGALRIKGPDAQVSFRRKKMRQALLMESKLLERFICHGYFNV